ncbi:DNA topoisomerase 1 isoform X2 [Manihot esculenta]|uniref:Uncharacterized protein n=1 Tax=Manihot esculenta TaxID=3983 RepID=A0ACB7HW27_MANES|nr:DNA topoisomerase 1 isoform X2 [Manihot esculenta]KAG8656725.1 hypothetical protein MANES_03G000450v8 [Manihot esculenta]
MNQMPRSLLVASTCPSSFFCRTSSPSPLCPFMTKLHCGALQNHPAFHFLSSPFGTFHKHGQCSQLRLRKPRVSSMISISYSRVPLCLADGSVSVSAVDSCLRAGCFSSSMNKVIALNSRDCGGFARRHFSQVSRAKSQNEDGGFGKLFKQAKLLKSHVKKDIDSGLLASNDVNAMASAEDVVGDMKLGSSISSSSLSNNNPKSKVRGRQKKQSRTNTKKGQPSGVIASDEAAVVDSYPKSSTTMINSQSPTEGLEKKSNLKTPKELLDGSASTKKQSNKKNRNPSGKGKSVKAVNESAEKLKPQAMDKLKPLVQGTQKPLYPPTGKSVVVVESITKAKVFQGYLGDMFEVLPSYGHVRDLAARSGSVRPDEDFSMVWEVPSAAWTHLKSIKVALSGAKNLILASDPDREGEAIAWHIIEMLQQQDALHEGITLARVVFHEITEQSIKNALQAPREIDLNLVHAYLARRALDYLIGFNISPLLWRKLPGCQSAGRVQSAALSLICDREMEIDEFKPQEYWTIAVELYKSNPGSSMNTHLTHFDSNKLNQLSISSHSEAKDIEQKIKVTSFLVAGVKESKMRRNPPTPYITSTLQQDAANKLHFPSMYTMKLAQKLYEGIQLSDGKAMGLITYIRTDGLHISKEAVKEIRSLVIERYGKDFASGGQLRYFKKVKNAQEAHEAIRPTNIWMLPSMLVDVLDEDSLKLYTLIWSRTVACQMEPVIINQMQVDIRNADGSITLRSSCSGVGFLGYQAVYEDIKAGAVRYKENEAYDHQEAFASLKSLKPGDLLNLGEVKLKQHFTQPPPRYSEGSLVKKLEELGIGRPSTYASTLKVLQDRHYVTVKSRVLYPEFRGRMVSAFLSHHFTEVTDYSFTADMETELDNVSAGLTEWKGLLRDYWTRFSSYCNRAESIHIHQVEKMLEKAFGDFLFGSLPDNSRACPSCLEGTLIFKVSRYGAGYFIGCDQHPKCKYIAKTLYGDEEEEEETPQNKSMEEPRLLGVHPVSNEKVLLKNGPYGFYVQLGEDRKDFTPKRASVSHIKDVDSITLDGALQLLRYPVTLGNHPKDGHPVILKLAKVGFAVRHRRTIASVPKLVGGKIGGKAA